MKRLASPSRRAQVTAATLLALATLAACDRKKPAPDPPTAQTSTTATARTDGETTAAPDDAPRDDDAPRRVVDVHTHLTPGADDLILERIAPLGVERVVNLSGGSTDERLARNLRHARRLDGRLGVFVNLPWRSFRDDPGFPEEAAAFLRRSVRAGAAGLKISKGLGLGYRDPDGELLAVDDPRLDPIWEEAARLGIPVSIHTGDPRAFWQEPGPDNERHAELSLAPGWSYHGRDVPSREELLAQRDRMIARHPDTSFVLVHLANNPEDIDYVDALMREHEHVYLDISARVAEFGRHDPGRMRRFFREFSDRVLFGTDLQASARRTAEAVRYSLTLGSISREPPTLDELGRFYRLHYRYFELAPRRGPDSGRRIIAHPVPIQGDWEVYPIGLPADSLHEIYYKNAERVVFAPHFGRSRAYELARTAEQILSGESP
jgi:predicted TIM-barrel fold metal-dependent hydrolase